VLGWLNSPDRNNYQEASWEAAGRRAIRRFLVSFDESAGAGHVEIMRRDKARPRFIPGYEPSLALDTDTLTNVLWTSGICWRRDLVVLVC